MQGERTPVEPRIVPDVESLRRRWLEFPEMNIGEERVSQKENSLI